jgi:protein involved in polysaccharide export with SLBB domain
MPSSSLAVLVRVLYAAPFVWGLSAGPVAAQQPAALDTRRVYATRADLQALLPGLDSAARARVRARLAEGDFQPGDRVLLNVEGEQQLADTFTVDDARTLRLPTIGEVPLKGVLRSELEDYLRTRLAVYIQKPIVRARPLIRIGVIGEVGRPGFYLVPPTSQLEDVIMIAGGPTHDSKLKALVVQRTDGEVLGKEVLQQAMIDGRSLDQLGMRSGDRLFLPKRHDLGRSTTTVITIVTALVTIPAAIFGITRLF